MNIQRYHAPGAVQRLRPSSLCRLDGLRVACWGLCAALCGLSLAGHAVNQGQTWDFLCDFNAIYIWDVSVAFDGMYMMGFIWDLPNNNSEFMGFR